MPEIFFGALKRDLAPESWAAAARAIMTTDTFPKGATRQAEIGGQSVTLNGIAKGPGMIPPDMATMPAFVVTDANRDHPLRLIRAACEILFRVVSVRPDVVISTGAAPGVFGIIFGRLVGARTIWVESIANAEVLSLSGRIALKFAHIVLTQWPHLARAGGPQYHGSIL